MVTRYEWRYLPGGVVSHIVGMQHMPVLAHESASCGRGPGLLGDWFGTGSQLEYETCAARPACKRCLAEHGLTEDPRG